MNKTQRSRSNMRKQIKQLVNSTSALITSDIPMFMTWFLIVVNIMDDFTIFLEKQEANRSGLQVNKKAIKAQLVISAANIAANLQSYANAINDLVLYNDMAYTKTKLEKLPATDLIVACNLIGSSANDNLASLGPYDINTLSMIDFNSLVASFESADPLPEAGIQERQAATIALQASIDESDIYLKKMDKAVKGKKLKYPTFYLDWFRARKLIPLPAHVNAAQGLILNEAGEPMPFVHISCAAIGLRRKATKHGRFTLRYADEGIQTITYEFPGYETVHQQVTFYTGLRADILVTMRLHVVPA